MMVIIKLISSPNKIQNALKEPFDFLNVSVSFFTNFVKQMKVSR